MAIKDRVVNLGIVSGDVDQTEDGVKSGPSPNVAVSEDDPKPSYLFDKFKAGPGANLTTITEGGAEKIQIAIVGNGLTYSVKTTSFTAAINNAYLVDTTGGPIEALLPPSPVMGDIIVFTDVASNFDNDILTINRNGNPIMGLNENMTCGIKNVTFTLVYSNASEGWRIDD